MLILPSAAPLPPLNPATQLPWPKDALCCRLTIGAYRNMTGQEEGLFCLRISLRSPFWRFDLMDFMDFHKGWPSPILLFADDERIAEAKSAYKGHSYKDGFLRSYEPAVLVHSTDPDGWIGIEKDGALLSWSALAKRRQAREASPIGSLLGDPDSFRDYIMFSDCGHLAGELVVSSRQSGFINMDENAAYRPGARLYFDAAAIARDGLLLRDGAHLKVHGRLPLFPYLLFCASCESLGLSSPLSTPKTFRRLADEAFLRLHSDKKQEVSPCSNFE